jgi:hypothetical protein
VVTDFGLWIWVSWFCFVLSWCYVGITYMFGLSYQVLTWEKVSWIKVVLKASWINVIVIHNIHVLCFIQYFYKSH